MNSHSNNRKEKLLELIHQRKNITIKDLSQNFNGSIPTLYRDLDSLEKERFIQKFRGGVRYIKGTEKEHGFFYRAEINVKYKKYIAKNAIKYIKSGDIIFIDASTTSFYLCKELKNSNIDNLTIFTNGLFVPSEFLIINNFNVISFGGILDRELASFVKNDLHFFLKKIKYLKYFGSAFAFSCKFGAMDQFGLEEVRVANNLLPYCSEIFLLIDSSKFKRKGTYNWLEIDKIDKIITDFDIDKEIVDLLLEKGVEVIY